MKRYRLLLCLLILYLLSTGCSIIGLAIGANTETEEVYYKTVESNSPEFKSLELAEGDSIKIVTNDGDSLSGIFIQYQPLSFEEYTKGFINAFSNMEYFPKPYDTLWAQENDNNVCYEFLGFEYKNILVKDEKNDTVVISLNEPFILLEEGNKILKKNEFIELIKNKNEVIKSVSFHRYMQLMELYARHNNEKILIKNMEDIVIIPLDDISQMIVQHSKNYALEGILVGLGIDVLIVVLLIDMGNHMPSR